MVFTGENRLMFLFHLHSCQFLQSDNDCGGDHCYCDCLYNCYCADWLVPRLIQTPFIKKRNETPHHRMNNEPKSIKLLCIILLRVFFVKFFMKDIDRSSSKMQLRLREGLLKENVFFCMKQIREFVVLTGRNRHKLIEEGQIIRSKINVHRFELEFLKLLLEILICKLDATQELLALHDDVIFIRRFTTNH